MIQLDLTQPITPQLDAEIKKSAAFGLAFRRIDASRAVCAKLSKELSRMSVAERAAANSLSDQAMIWRWRGIPIRPRQSLPDNWCVLIGDMGVATFRGEPLVQAPTHQA